LTSPTEHVVMPGGLPLTSLQLLGSETLRLHLCERTKPTSAWLQTHDSFDFLNYQTNSCTCER